MIGNTALKIIADKVLTLAVEQCPVDTASLATSGKVIGLGRGIVMVSFGEGIVEGESRFNNRKIGSNIDYATFVHEDVTVFHYYGKAKFLEDAALYVLGICISNEIPVSMKIELGMTLNGSSNCIAVYIYDPNIVKDSLVPGETLGGQLGSINNKESGGPSKTYTGVWSRIKTAITIIADSIRTILEVLRK